MLNSADELKFVLWGKQNGKCSICEKKILRRMIRSNAVNIDWRELGELKLTHTPCNEGKLER